MSDYEDYEDFEFREEKNAGERAGAGHTYIDTDEVEKDVRLKTPLELFITNIRQISNDIINNKYLSPKIFNKSDLELILKSIYLFDKPEYKNPLCFIFGYIATEGGSVINEKKLYELYNNIETVDSTGNIQPPDIIRYCTLWINTVLNK